MLAQELGRIADAGCPELVARVKSLRESRLTNHRVVTGRGLCRFYICYFATDVNSGATCQWLDMDKMKLERGELGEGDNNIRMGPAGTIMAPGVTIGTDTMKEDTAEDTCLGVGRPGHLMEEIQTQATHLIPTRPGTFPMGGDLDPVLGGPTGAALADLLAETLRIW